MNIFDKLTQGSILGETQYYVVQSKKGQEVTLVPEGSTNPVTVNDKYVNTFLHSADSFETTEKKNQTELINVVVSNPRTVMTIEFVKKDELKSKKVFEAEKANKLKEIESARLKKDRTKLIMDLLENPITQTIPGETRIIKGFHAGMVDDRGRVTFFDLEQPKGAHNVRQVDSRTVKSVIVNGVKYVLSK